jgi:hypothetical protein
MENNKFQTTFIPKKTVGPNAVKPPHTTNFFSLIVIILFSTVILLTLVVYGYQYQLKKNNEALKTKLDATIAAINATDINDLSRLDARIESSKALIAQHTALTSFLQFLSASTLKSVRFTNFHFSNANQKLTVTMDGEAQSYAALALQTDEFSLPESRKYLKEAVVSNFLLDPSGNITFNFSGVLNQNVLLYKDTLPQEASSN